MLYKIVLGTTAVLFVGATLWKILPELQALRRGEELPDQPYTIDPVPEPAELPDSE